MAARLALGCMLCMCASGRESVFGAGNGRGSAGRGGVEPAEYTYSRRCSTRTDFTFDTHITSYSRPTWSVGLGSDTPPRLEIDEDTVDRIDGRDKTS